MKRHKVLKVLISAYACEPGRGSEPAVGWSMACEAARRHEVWVITWTRQRSVIEAEMAVRPVPRLRVVYCDLPSILRWWTPEEWGMQIHYYLWQLLAYRIARQLDQQIQFDLTHHVTFVKYWQPTLLHRLRAPFLWGPVGGADAAPSSFRRDLTLKGQAYEWLRDVAVWCGERDPLVRATARRSCLALAATRATATRLRVLGADNVEVLSAIGLGAADRWLLDMPSPPADGPVRFLSSGRLLDLKAFHLGLRAFASARLTNSELWLVGDGPARAGLERLARDLGVADRVRFWGTLPRADALAKLASCHVLVHPSLHDSGGFVCLEALAAGRPVICLDLAGPAELVTPECGIKIPAREPGQAQQELAGAMETLARDPSLRARLGSAARSHVVNNYSWEQKGKQLSDYYHQLAAHAADRPAPKVTVVVPTFDRPQALARALDSLVAQQTDQFVYEIVVVDNAPRLDTREVVEAIAQVASVQVRYVPEERAGVSHARNKGVMEATGRWIAFCDDDQVADASWLRQLVSVARVHEAACVGGSIRLTLPQGTPAIGGVCRRLLGEQPFNGTPFTCTGRHLPSTGNLMVSRSVFEQLGPFDTAMTAGGEDYEFVRRIRAAGGRVLVAPAAVMHHVIPPYRTRPEYLNWVSRRVGAGLAYTDLKRHGPWGVALRCVARMAQAGLVTLPKLALAPLYADDGVAQDCRALLWRASAYAQQTASLLRSPFTSERRFPPAIESRQERGLFEQHP